MRALWRRIRGSGWWTWRSRRKLRARVAEANANGNYYLQIVLWDGAGERFGGVAEIEPERVERIIVEMAKSTAYFAEHPQSEEARKREGFTQARPPVEPEGRDPTTMTPQES